MSYNNFEYYQPNKKDLKDEYGDCVIRALTKAFNKSWSDVFQEMIPICLEKQCLHNNKPAYETILSNHGFTYHGISNKKGSTRPRVHEFAKHENRKCVLIVANHVVASSDGKYYDTWDSGDKALYGYWIKED